MLMPYLKFRGDCEAAFKWYEKVFDAEIQHLSRFGDVPGAFEFALEEEQKNKVMHGQIKLNTYGFISGADCMRPFTDGNPVSLQIHLEKEAEARQIFRKLSQGGDVICELLKNPPPDDNSLSGMIVDKYGIEWIISSGID